jgi:hypothetical protein
MTGGSERAGRHRRRRQKDPAARSPPCDGIADSETTIASISHSTLATVSESELVDDGVDAKRARRELGVSRSG